MVGAGLVLSSLVFWRFAGNVATPEGEYVPPRMENGEIVPGHFE